MSLSLKPINFEEYSKNKNFIIDLIKRIWKRPESFENALDSIQRWFDNKEGGNYFYIIEDGEKIGVTGYWPIKESNGSFGLRHHGTTKKGTGRRSLGLLIEYLKNKYGDSFNQIIELLPEGKEELIKTFKKWGFELDPNGVPLWEPKRDYYKYSMIRKV